MTKKIKWIILAAYSFSSSA